jgi:hypothetical protein
MSIVKPTIVEKWQKKNKYGRPGTHLNYTKVAIHYTGQADVPGKNTVNYFNNVVANGYRVNGRYIYASAHFVIDLDGTIYQLIPLNEICYCTNSANAYAVGVEVATTGKDDHYTDATYKSMVWLCTWLCANKGLNPKKDIIRHTDVVGRAYKLCPIYMVLNEDKYEQFRLDCYNLKAGKISVNQIVNCTNGKGKVTIVPTTTTGNNKTLYVKILQDINMHSKPDFTSKSVIGVVTKGGVYTVVETIKRTGTDMYKLKSGVYITASPKYVEVFEK